MKKNLLWKHLLSLFFFLAATFPLVAQITINGSGSYATIQAAIDAASAGDIIDVPPGTYVENVLINKNNLVLRSSGGKAVTTIQGITPAPGSAAVRVASGTNGVSIGQAGKGFTIIGVDGNGPIEAAAIYLLGSHTNTTIEGNEIRANGDHGLLSNFNASIDGLLIKGNEFTGQTFTGPTPGDCGFGNQFNVGNNVPRQLVTIGGGATVTNTKNVFFIGNKVTGTAGGATTFSGCTVDGQGNTLVTIDVINLTATQNLFAGHTARFATSLRARGPNASVYCNIFRKAGTTASVNHILFGATSLVGATPNTIAGVATQNSFPDGGGYNNADQTTIYNDVSVTPPVASSAATLPDSDGDGVLDACDDDIDGDGVLNADDCAPNDPTKWQSATLYVDADGDGYDNGTQNVCYGSAIPTGYSTTTNGPDCNDNDPSTHAIQTYYADSDNDGYGDPNNSIQSCGVPAGYVSNNTDNCPTVYNPSQADEDNDGQGDACDVTCGKKNENARVCHNGNEICISWNAVAAHLAHGDVLGPCSVAPRPVEELVNVISGEKIVVYPNPSRGVLFLKLPTAEKAEIVITNSNGAVVQRKSVNATSLDQVQAFDLGKNGPGMYFIRIVTAEGVQTSKIIVQR